MLDHNLLEDHAKLKSPLIMRIKNTSTALKIYSLKHYRLDKSNNSPINTSNLKTIDNSSSLFSSMSNTNLVNP